MSSEIGYRLSFNELIFLAAKTEATEIYGLKHANYKYSPEALTKTWDLVREGLLEKAYLVERDDGYAVDTGLFELISVISQPRLFYVCQSKDDLSGYNCNYYIRNKLAVKLEYEASYKDIYTLTPYTDEENLKKSVQGFFEISGKSFEQANEKIVLGLDEFTEFITAITDNDQQQQVSLLEKKGIQQKYIQDISKSLSDKNCLRTMLVISFSPKAPNEKEMQNSVVKEYMIYGGARYLWQIELKEKKATIESISNAVMMHKMEVLANVLYYI